MMSEKFSVAMAADQRAERASELYAQYPESSELKQQARSAKQESNRLWKDFIQDEVDLESLVCEAAAIVAAKYGSL